MPVSVTPPGLTLAALTALLSGTYLPGSVLLDTGPLAGAVASVDLQNISATAGAHLEAIIMGRNSVASINGPCDLKLNNDGGTNYYQQELTSASTSTGSSFAGAQTTAFLGQLAGDGATADYAGIVRAIIPNYAGTVWNKHVRSDFVQAITTNAGYTILGGVANWWGSKAAINRLTFIATGGTFMIGTRIIVRAF